MSTLRSKPDPDPDPDLVSPAKRDGSPFDSDLLPASKRLVLDDRYHFAATTSSSINTLPVTTPADIKATDQDDISMTDDDERDVEKDAAVPRLSSKDKGKAKMMPVPLLPEELWKRVFELYYDQCAEDWHASGNMKGGLLPLLISPAYTAVATSVLYAHPHISRQSIDAFIKCAQLPSTHNGVAAKKQLVRHLTVRPSLVEPNGEHPVVHPVHPSFPQLTMLVPFLHSFTLKDTLVVDDTDAERLFGGLRHLQPRKARLELRMWNLQGTAAGADLMTATKPNIYARGFPTQMDKWGTGPESDWLQAIANQRDYDVPAFWLDPRPSPGANANAPAFPGGQPQPAPPINPLLSGRFSAFPVPTRQARAQARQIMCLPAPNSANDDDNVDDGSDDDSNVDAEDDDDGDIESLKTGLLQSMFHLIRTNVSPLGSTTATNPATNASTLPGATGSTSTVFPVDLGPRGTRNDDGTTDWSFMLGLSDWDLADFTFMDHTNDPNSLDEEQLITLNEVLNIYNDLGWDLRDSPTLLIRNMIGLAFAGVTAPRQAVRASSSAPNGNIPYRAFRPALPARLRFHTLDGEENGSTGEQVNVPTTSQTRATSAPPQSPERGSEAGPASTASRTDDTARAARQRAHQSAVTSPAGPTATSPIAQRIQGYDRILNAAADLLAAIPVPTPGTDAGVPQATNASVSQPGNNGHDSIIRVPESDPTQSTLSTSPTPATAAPSASANPTPLPPNHWSHRVNAMTPAQRGRWDHIYYPPADDDDEPVAGPSNSAPAFHSLLSHLAPRPARTRGAAAPDPVTAPPLNDRPALAITIRRLLLKLITRSWADSINAFSFVAFDPAASLVVRAAQLDFWTQVPIDHIRVHLPLGVNSLAVFKGIKQNARDRIRNRLAAAASDSSSSSEDDDPAIYARRRLSSTLDDMIANDGGGDADEVVGGDGAGGGLVHPSNRLFEIEVNTVREMQDDMWSRAGSQLPPQVCRILLGEQDWALVRSGPARSPSIDPLYVDPAPISPATADYPSPSYSFSSFDSGSDDDNISEMGGDGDDGRGAGESYDAEAAKSQAARLAAKKLGEQQ